MWIDDEIIRQCHRPSFSKVWFPETSIIVLGSSNKAEVEADEAACARDGVTVLKRYGGGGTVLLHPDCLIVSFGAWVREEFQNKKYFAFINGAVIKALGDVGYRTDGFLQLGLSDIVMGQKKIGGTSLFRSRHYLLYQASLLYRTRVEEIEKYLKHPSKEPDYRKHRTHREFLMGLEQHDPGIKKEKLESLFPHAFEGRVAEELKDELVPPTEAFIPHLLKRAEPRAP
jgi:lipoate---protein ligase